MRTARQIRERIKQIKEAQRLLFGDLSLFTKDKGVDADIDLLGKADQLGLFEDRITALQWVLDLMKEGTYFPDRVVSQEAYHKREVRRIGASLKRAIKCRWPNDTWSHMRDLLSKRNQLQTIRWVLS